MGTEAEKTITCRQCGKGFVFTSAEQEFYEQKGFAVPNHCKECRSNRRIQNNLVCAKCGTGIGRGAAVCCSACSVTAQLEFEMELRKLQNKLDEANEKLSALESEKTQLAGGVEARVTAVESEKAQMLHEVEAKLSAVESEKVELAASLQRQEQLAAELQKKLDNATTELEKQSRYRAALDWLEPAFNTIKERLEILERNQNSLTQIITELMQGVRKALPNPGLLETLRRVFRLRRKSAPSTG